MPLQRRIPKRGFTNIFAKSFQIVNVGHLAQFDGGSEVNAKILKRKGLIRSENEPIKVLGTGALDGPITVVADAFSGRPSRSSKAPVDGRR